MACDVVLAAAAAAHLTSRSPTRAEVR